MSAQPTTESIRFFKRSLLCGIIVLCLFLMLLVRLMYLQVVKHTFYATLSQKNIISVIPIQPERGLIYDRNGVLLAKNEPVYSLTLIPGRIHDIQKTIKALTPVVDLTSTDIKNFHNAMKQYYPYQPVPLKKQITEEEADQFYVNQYRFPGAVIQQNTVRNYPLNKVASNVVGYVGRINAKELADVDAADYSASDDIGKAGVEREDETLWHGTMGFEEAEIDANGKAVRILKQTAPIPGANIYLTIDSQLQAYIEKIMEKNTGAVVAIQPTTGQVLALVTKPSYDPNLFVQGMTNAEYQALLTAKNHPLFNRATRGLYAPGSTVKPFIAFYPLNNNIIDTKDYIFDPGWFRLPNATHVFHDWKKGGHGWVNIEKAIYMSCDTFFYQLADTLTIDKLDPALSAFGFGQKTGINLPEERAGVVPSPAWKMGHIGLPWYGADTIMAGFGQGYLLVTPLQLADAAATLANRGQKFTPNVLLEIRNPDGTAENIQPNAQTTVTTNNPTAWNTVIAAMQQVVLNNDGTAHFSFGTGTPYTVAAKTGTAQVHGIDRSDPNQQNNEPKRLRDNHWLIAFAPVDHPQIAIAVLIEHNPIANQVARKTLDFYFNELKTAAAQTQQQNAALPAIPVPSAQSTPAPTTPKAPAPTSIPASALPVRKDGINNSNALELQQEMDTTLDMQMQLESQTDHASHNSQ